MSFPLAHAAFIPPCLLAYALEPLELPRPHVSASGGSLLPRVASRLKAAATSLATRVASATGPAASQAIHRTPVLSARKFEFEKSEEKEGPTIVHDCKTASRESDQEITTIDDPQEEDCELHATQFSGFPPGEKSLPSEELIAELETLKTTRGSDWSLLAPSPFVEKLIEQADQLGRLSPPKQTRLQIALKNYNLAALRKDDPVRRFEWVEMASAAEAAIRELQWLTGPAQTSTASFGPQG